MMSNNKNAQFYFANLGADIMRCVSAAKKENDKMYDDSLTRAKHTLSLLRDAENSGAYEEGLLLFSALEQAKKDSTLDAFSVNLNKITSQMMSS